MFWRVRGRVLDGARPLIVGILNVTPDSFSDRGAFASPADALHQAETLVREGADVLDLGGESTRPGAEPVSAEEELRRVMPVLKEALGLGVPVSIDTYKASVARAALEAGAAIVNDITALGDPEMAETVASFGAGLILMHMQGTPQTMQKDPRYADVVDEVRGFLARRRGVAERGGVPTENIVLDPGVGFGKALEHNLELLARMDELVAMGSPILVGVSRKRFIGALAGVEEPRDRGPGSLAAMLAARMKGVSIFRVHDAGAARQALTVFDAVQNQSAKR
ncbi:MAG TPA: dihydropteroate synthase [Dongiaceae bacterium]|nr:dihydropteroate synthase [Dongiaceae bacterium]